MRQWKWPKGVALLAGLVVLGLTAAPTASAAAIERQNGPPRFDLPPGQATSAISLAQLGLGDQVVSGIFPNIDLWFPGPGEVNVGDGSQLRLVLSYPDILLADVSTVTVQVNSIPVATYRLERAQAKRFVSQVDLPGRYLRADANQIKLSFAMRLAADQCRDLDNPALSAVILNETAIAYPTALGPRTTGPAGLALPPEGGVDLARFPAPFFQPLSPFPTTLTWVAPAAPSVAEQTAMASIGAKIGQLGAQKTITASVYTADTLPASLRSNANLIVVGTPASNPLINQLGAALPLRPSEPGFLNPTGAPIAPEQGVIQVTASPYAPGRAILIVSGGSDEGVRRSAQVLATTSLRKLLTGPYAIVADQPVAPAGPIGRDGGRTFTLADLGYEDSVVSGIGDQRISLSFDAPATEDRSGGTIDVVWSHSIAGMTELSSMSVLLNGVPIGNAALRETNVNRAVTRVNIPPTTLQPGPNALQFLFVFQPKDQVCARLVRDAAWGVIHQDTEIRLPHSPTGAALGLQFHPYPFVKDGKVDDTILALPSAPSSADLSIALQLAIDLGKRTRSDATWLEAQPSDTIGDAQRRGHNLVAIGVPTANPLIQQLNDRLPAPLAPDGLSLRQGTQTLVTLQTNGQAGIVQLLPSPFSDGQADRTAILVVSGATTEAVEWARAGLATGRLSGNVAIVSRDLRVQTFDVSAASAGPIVLANPRATIPAAATIAAGIIIVTLLGIIVVQLVRERRRRHEAGSYPPSTVA
ncbi:MAG: cellulose biosynthesis cyclic di-GMP-binding regulatory protein BcsB [Dehalococcoidia bacterium]